MSGSSTNQLQPQHPLQQHQRLILQNEFLNTSNELILNQSQQIMNPLSPQAIMNSSANFNPSHSKS